MRNLFLIFLSVLLLSCGTKSVQETAEKPVEQVPTSIVAATVEPEIPALPMPTGSKEKEGESALKEEEDEFLEYATYYVTIADTGQSYFPLRAEMVRLSKEMNLPVDTMGRYYDRKKDLIVLPEDDEDEVYAGDYFPRRNPDAFLSLEYLDLYQDKAKEKT
ncbi:MAG: hypothetical protein ACO1OQ_16675, partial [Rufibacter sp.]